MVSTSLVDQVAALRRTYTAEPNTSAAEAVRPVLQRLDRTDRNRVVDALRANYDSSVRHPAWTQPSMPDLRELLLPAAGSAGQRELECGLLDSISSTTNALHLRPPASLMRPATVLRRLTITATGDLNVHVDEPALGPLLTALLPAPFNGEQRGVPGLRYRQHKRHGELYLLDAVPAARIILAAVKAPVARRALDYVSDDTGLALDEVQSILLARHLAPSEQDWIEHYGRTVGDPPLGSALLRRIFALGRPLWFSTWSTGVRHMLWPAGRAPADVAEQLTHPLLGLPGVYRTDRHDEGITALRKASSGRVDQHLGLLLRRESAPTTESDMQLQSRLRTWEPSVAWQRWSKTHTAGAGTDQ
ncbi:hypothetical protein [Micromonospora sp. CA-248212]|uniref:hypothetical protein n=1 Tax=Micromonospora sp. CA-248212 TaxID=3239961 RepID=UPI003D94669D